MSGKRIIDSLKEAVAGNFARVTIDGQVWVRREDYPYSELDTDMHVEAVTKDLRAEIERLRARVAELEEPTCPHGLPVSRDCAECGDEV